MKETAGQASPDTLDGNLAAWNWPRSFSVLPIRNMVLFPQTIIPLVVTRDSAKPLLERAKADGDLLCLFAQKEEIESTPTTDDLHPVGTLARILRVLEFPDGSQRLLVKGIARIHAESFEATAHFFTATVNHRPEIEEADTQSAAHAHALKALFGEYQSLNPNLPNELDANLSTLEQPGRVADFVLSNINLPFPELQSTLQELDTLKRLEFAIGHLSREIEVLKLSATIQKQVQVAMDKNQRDYYLKEQLKTLRKELGEIESGSEEIQEFAERIKKAGMPPEVEKEATRELERMSRIHPEAAEYTVSRTYLDWLISMPWNKVSKNKGAFESVQRALDEDHFGLEKVKERILEYLAVRKLKPDAKGPVLCFLGPPGVGKTSLGKSIARAIGRKFQRVSLGGVRDESEIRGHRRTYIGAMPGRVIKAMRKAGTMNPVLMLDELDKVGNDFRGDPASALLEVLDPEQNSAFSDHYLDVPFDLSQVMFIATANRLDTIPSALRDRLEIIEVPGYIEEEKIQIANHYLIPKQLKKHGLTRRYLRIEDDATQAIIRSYASEAGVRNLEREVASLCRKVAKRLALNDRSKKVITGENIEDWLGPKKYLMDVAERVDTPGIAVGLAWTPIGGDILFIESTKMKGKRGFKITGKLGDVMKESAEAAMSYLRTNSPELGIAEDAFNQFDVHVHIPAGAVPKDGPSAGVTLLVALTSLFSGRLVRSDLAMTGEITLRGKILPVGGVKEKVLAARRAGIQTVILPARNAKDLIDVPKELQEGMNFYFVENVREILDLALLKPGEGPKDP